MVEFKLKRVYDAAAADDGLRVLVDRLWPRGLTKERAAVDVWAKDVAPSNELRKTWHGGGETWEAFTANYEHELDANPAVAELAAQLANDPVVTLLYGAKDTGHTHAAILQAALERALSAK